MYIYGKPFIFPIHYIFIPGNNKIDACHFQDSLIFALRFPTLQTSKAHQQGGSVSIDSIFTHCSMCCTLAICLVIQRQ